MEHYVADDLATLGRAGAVDAMRGYLRATAAGHANAPPRIVVPVGSRELVFTVGGDADADIAGFRLYSIDREHGSHEDSQALMLLRLGDGKILASARGPEFGAWRTAALGAVAMHEGTRSLDRPIRAAVLGAGFQAGHHTRTWLATRPIERMTIWARRLEAAQALAAALTLESGVEVVAEARSERAVDGADAVLGVTASSTPVVDASALAAAPYVATVGPKFGGRHELPAGVYAAADTLVSDAPAQCRTFEETRGPMPGDRRAEEMLALADVVAGTAALPPDGRVLFVSEGLAGSEVALLGALHRLRTGA